MRNHRHLSRCDRAPKTSAKAAQKRYEEETARVAAANAQFEREKAQHAQELARVKAAEAEYQRQLETYRRDYQKATGKVAPQ